MFGERALHTRRKGLQNKIENRAEESDKATVQRERFVGVRFAGVQLGIFEDRGPRVLLGQSCFSVHIFIGVHLYSLTAFPAHSNSTFELY